MSNYPTLPQGYRYLEVTLELSESEYRWLTYERVITGPGTYGAAVRLKMGWAARPRGLRSALERMSRK